MQGFFSYLSDFLPSLEILEGMIDSNQPKVLEIDLQKFQIEKPKSALGSLEKVLKSLDPIAFGLFPKEMNVYLNTQNDCNFEFLSGILSGYNNAGIVFDKITIYLTVDFYKKQLYNVDFLESVVSAKTEITIRIKSCCGCFDVLMPPSIFSDVLSVDMFPPETLVNFTREPEDHLHDQLPEEIAESLTFYEVLIFSFIGYVPNTSQEKVSLAELRGLTYAYPDVNYIRKLFSLEQISNSPIAPEEESDEEIEEESDEESDEESAEESVEEIEEEMMPTKRRF